MKRRTALESLDALDTFRDTFGRLPKSNATEPEEKRLATFLFFNLRPAERRGTLRPEVRERAALIPGALALDHHPDQDRMLHELAEFIRVNGHQPRHTRTGIPAAEAKLRYWISNHTAGDPGRKSPRLKERHLAIVQLLDRVPSYAEKTFEDRLAAAEEFIRVHGHTPPRSRTSWIGNYLSGVYPFDGPRKSRIDDLRAARLKAVMNAPSFADHKWAVQFADLSTYAAAHDGALPTSWDQGRVFSWLSVQRREYRKGNLSAEREATLRTLPGVLPGHQELARAA